MSTDIVKFKAEAPIGTVQNIRDLTEIEEAVAMIGRAFPGEWSDEDRTRKAKDLIGQAATYVANADDKDKGKGSAKSKLLGCVGQSVLEALMSLASVDLPLTKALDLSALIPYAGVCTHRITYKGWAHLYQRTGVVTSLQTGIIYKEELPSLEWQAGTDAFLRVQHRLDIDRRDENIVATYMIAYHAKGPPTIEVMDRKELDKVRRVSQKPDGSCYKFWLGQMYRKAPINRSRGYLLTRADPAGQALLAQALEIEHAKYDLARIEGYQDMRQLQSDEMRDKARSGLKGTRPPAGPTAPKPADLKAGKQALLNRVKKARKKTSSSMSDIEFCEQAIFDQLHKNKIDTLEELEKVNAAINSGMYDWDTGTRIPEAAGVK